MEKPGLGCRTAIVGEGSPKKIGLSNSPLPQGGAMGAAHLKPSRKGSRKPKNTSLAAISLPAIDVL